MPLIVCTAIGGIVLKIKYNKILISKNINSRLVIFLS